MSKESYYFRHDYGARNDTRIAELRATYGWSGYGIFFALIEIMAESKQKALLKEELNGIAFLLHLKPEELEDMLAFMVKKGLLVEEETLYYSRRLCMDFNERLAKSERAKANAERSLSKRKANSKQNDSKAKANLEQSVSKTEAKRKQSVSEAKATAKQTDSNRSALKEKERKGEGESNYRASVEGELHPPTPESNSELSSNPPGSPQFPPEKFPTEMSTAERLEKIQPSSQPNQPEQPTIEQVAGYAGLQSIPKDVAEKFFDHYESEGWKSGNGNNIVNWQAKLRKWWSDDKNNNSTNGHNHGKNNRTQRAESGSDSTDISSFADPEFHRRLAEVEAEALAEVAAGIG
jgi:hypothetical protein